MKFIRFALILYVITTIISSCMIINKEPNPPANPSPANNSTNIPIDATLRWDATDPDGDPLRFDVYFGTSSNPPLVAQNLTTSSYNPGTLNYSTTYYWKVVVKDDHGHITQGPVWRFTTMERSDQAPNTPTNPSPTNNSTNVPIDVTLRWSATDPDGDPLTFDVYFGTSSNPPLVAQNLTTSSYDPGTLNYSTTYYWKVVAKDDHGHTTQGPVWSFTTMERSNQAPNTPTNPSPANNATNVPIDVTLSWDATDPDGDPLTFDVYFGTSSNPPLVAQNLTTSSYDPGTLNYSTTYYWKVVAKDDHGNTTEGPVWSFTTSTPYSPDILWQKALGGSSYDKVNSVIETTDGGYLVAGDTLSNDGDVSGWHEGYDEDGDPYPDMWVVKLDVNGNIIWQKALGGSSYDEANSVIETTDGGYLVVGYTESNDGDVSGYHGWADMWVVKLR